MRLALVCVFTACWQGTVIEATGPETVGDKARVVVKATTKHAVRNVGEAPSIELAEALSAARHYARERGVRFEHQYLQGAVFDSSARQWVFDWQTPMAKGGLTIVTVHESGTITMSFGD